MKALPLFICILFCQFTANGKTLPAHWKPVYIPGLHKSWENNNAPGNIITVFKKKMAAPTNFNGAKQVDIASGIVSLRQLTLEQFGFTEIAVQKFERSNGSLKKARYEKVTLAGSYRQPDNTQVQFLEHQYFFDKTFYQVSFLLESEDKNSAFSGELYLNQLTPRPEDLY